MPGANVRKLVVIALVIALAAVIGGCGSDQPESNDTDVAFVEAMIPHNAITVASSQYQYENGDDAGVRKFARDVVNVQMAEISELDRVGKQIGAEVDPAFIAPLNAKNNEAIFGPPDETTTAALTTLGVTAEQAGMTGLDAKATDANYVAMMIPLHEGAIRMARIEVEKGSNPELVKLARNVISNQSQEIGELKQIKP